MKWPLLILMSITVLTMLGFPGCYDSKRRMVAASRYYVSPGETTKRDLREAKLGDWKDIAIYEGALGSLFVVTFLAYLKVEKTANKDEN